MKLLLPVAIGLLLNACGDDGGRIRDAAATGDVLVVHDAPAIDAAPLPVTLTVTAGGSGLAGVVVYFQNADSSLVAEAMTDGSGNVAQLMAAGGFVTALVPNPVLTADIIAVQNVTLSTFAGVKPGDHLQLQQQDNSNELIVSVVAPLYQNNGAFTYEMFTTCDDGNPTALFNGSGNVTGTAALTVGCTTADVTLWAGSGTNVVGTATGVPITSNLDLRTIIGAYTAPTTVTLSFTDIAATISSLTAKQGLLTTRGVLLANTTVSSDITANAASGTLSEPTITGARDLTTTTPQFAAGTDTGQQQIIEVSAAAATYALDVGANVLHEYTSQPAYTQATRTVAWTQTTDGSAADVNETDLFVTRGTASWDWQIVAAGPGASIVYPTLPTDVFDYNPGASDTTNVDDLESLKVPGGYDAVRAVIFLPLSNPGVLLGTAGRATHENLAPPLPSLRSRKHAHRAPFGLAPSAQATTVRGARR